MNKTPEKTADNTSNLNETPENIPLQPTRSKGRFATDTSVPCDVDTLIALKSAGKSYREISVITGLSKDKINRKIKDLLPTANTEQYKTLRADILAEIQRKLLLQVDPERLKKMPAASAILAACQLYDKERIERGLSNNEQPVMIIIKSPSVAIDTKNKVIDVENTHQEGKTSE